VPAAQPTGRRRYKVIAGYNRAMRKPRYTQEHAEAGLDHKFPAIETWHNQFPGYDIVVDVPEFTSICPKTSLPDFGTVTIRYMPDEHCLELKSLKEYLQCYRNLGIFQENIVNRVLEDVVRWAKPVWVEVKGDFRPRGGISTVVLARWPRPKRNTLGQVSPPARRSEAPQLSACYIPFPSDPTQTLSLDCAGLADHA
jgi:7-cyano-7-deazaguanine reductase